METKKFKCKDEVIYRRNDDDDDVWTYGVFSHYFKSLYKERAVINGNYIALPVYYILPYEGNEELVGTTDSPDEEIRLEEGEWVVFYRNQDDNFKHWAIGEFKGIYRNDDGIDKFEIYTSPHMFGYTFVPEQVVRFSDFNPNDMEATKAKILCVKNRKIIRYKG